MRIRNNQIVLYRREYKAYIQEVRVTETGAWLEQKTENNKRTIRRMGISWHMILEHKVLLNLMSLEHEGSDGMISQG